MKNKVRYPIIYSLTVLFVAYSLSGCRRGEQELDKELVVSLGSSIVTLDPMRATEVYSGRVVTQIFEGLVGLNGSNEIVPLLAESWETSDDGALWTFHLREGVYFHPHPDIASGSQRLLVADDVVFCLSRLLSAESPFAFTLLDVVKGAMAYNSGESKTVSGIRVLDPLTVEVSLNFPDPFFLNRITSQVFGIYPHEAVESGPDSFGTTMAPGTGPFRLKGSRKDDQVLLEQNPNYWGQISGNVDSIEFRVVQNDSLRLTDLRNSHIDLVWLPFEQMREVFEPESLGTSVAKLNRSWSNSFSYARFDTFNSHFLSLNNEKFDTAFRRAVALAINREQIVRAVTFGAAQVASGPLPLAIPGYEAAFPSDIHDPVAARKALSESSFDPTKDSLEILVHGREGSRATGELIQEQLRIVGIKATLVELDFNEVFMRLIQGNYQSGVFFFEYVFSTSRPILENFFILGRVPNIWNYSNASISEEIESMRTITDRTELNEAARRIEQVLVSEASSAFLFQRQNLVLYRQRLSGVTVNGHSMPILSEVRVGE